jgi:hypothetical protein
LFEVVADFEEGEGDFRDEYGFGASGEGDFEGNESVGSSHDFDNEDTLVGVGGVADFVDGLEGGVDSGIESDTVVGSGNVVIDGTGDTHNRKCKFFVDGAGTGEGSIPADDDKSVDFVFAKDLDGLFATGSLTKFGAAGGAEGGSTLGDDSADGDGVKGDEFFGDDAAIAVEESDDIDFAG